MCFYNMILRERAYVLRGCCERDCLLRYLQCKSLRRARQGPEGISVALASECARRIIKCRRRWENVTQQLQRRRNVPTCAWFLGVVFVC